jgi:hypothetical protein
MGLWGSGSLPGKGHGGSKCDCCGTKITHQATKGPHIGTAISMSKNRYFCSNTCLIDWKRQNNYNG